MDYHDTTKPPQVGDLLNKIYCVGMCLLEGKHVYRVFDLWEDALTFAVKVRDSKTYKGVIVKKTFVWEM